MGWTLLLLLGSLTSHQFQVENQQMGWTLLLLLGSLASHQFQVENQQMGWTLLLLLGSLASHQFQVENQQMGWTLSSKPATWLTRYSPTAPGRETTNGLDIVIQTNYWLANIFQGL
jgi:hypothetical protein